MFGVSVAHSLELDSADAVADVLEQCRRQLEGLSPWAALFFTGIDHDFALILKEINAAYPDIQLIGCTTDGELSSVHGYSDDSITLMVFCPEELSFAAGVADNVSRDTVSTVKKAVDSTVSHATTKPTIGIVTPTGLTASADIMPEGLKLSLGETFPVFGGLAGDQWHFNCTYRFYKDSVYTDALPYLLISGPLLYSSAVETGWIPIGRKERITKSDNRIVYEIGNDTALQFYKHHLGGDIWMGEAGAISEYPLAILKEDRKSFYLRASIALDPGSSSITFVGNVPEDSMVQIAHSTRDQIVEAADRAIRRSVKGYPGTEPLAALCFSCCARKQVLGTRVVEEYQAIKKSSPDLPVAGFYGYGEYALLEARGAMG